MIVTTGVLIALAAQQWIEGRTWDAKARDSSAAVRTELGDHYANAVEWRMVQPCLRAQIARLQQRLIDSGGVLEPAPVFEEASFSSYVLRLPSKTFNDGAWQSVVADGVAAHLSPNLRNELNEHYVQAALMAVMTDRNDRDTHRLCSLSRPLELDASARFSLIQTLDELRGRIDFMDLNSGQLLDHVTKVRMVPDPSVVRHLLERSGTRQLCVRERLPLRSLKEASTPIDYFYSPQHIVGSSKL